MKTYVVGAGVSKTVNYPLGAELFSDVDQFIRSCGKCTDRFSYDTEWPAFCVWLADNPDPLIAGAYKTGDLETGSPPWI